jgi:hypothetical protein
VSEVLAQDLALQAASRPQATLDLPVDLVDVEDLLVDRVSAFLTLSEHLLTLF